MRLWGLIAYPRDMAFRPYPAKTVLAWTPADYLHAVSSADNGDLRNAADFTDAMLKDDRIGGVFEQRTKGMFALPSALETAGADTPPARIPEWPEAFPEAEQQLWLTWALALGFGWARRELVTIDGKLCMRVETWHPRWFSWRDHEQCWYVNARKVEAGKHVYGTAVYEKIVPGDGWLLYTPYGRHEPWKHGLWHRLAVPYLAKTFAIDDRSRDGEVTSLLVGTTKGLTEAQREKFLDDLLSLGRDTRVVLPENCDLKALFRNDSTTAGIHDRTIAWADGAITITIAGQIVTTEGTQGFSSGKVQKSILSSILRAQEESYSTVLGTSVVTPLARLYGWAGSIIYQRWQIQDSEDLNAQSFAIGQLAGSIDQLNRSLSVDGLRVDVAALVQRTGLPLLQLPASQEQSATQKLALAPTDIARVVTVNEGRASIGLPALPAGAGGDLSIAEYAARIAPPPVAPIQPAQPTAQSVPMTLSRNLHACAKAYQPIEGEPPESFVLLHWGANVSDKGTVHLDREGADIAMKAFGSRDIMIDLEHLSLKRDSPNYDPDARGWGKLALTESGIEVIGIKWTTDGDERIRSRKQRYTSPAFWTDDAGRVVEIINVALTALPATRDIEPLIAASKAVGGLSPKAKQHNRSKRIMTPEQLGQIAVILGLGEDASVGDILAALSEAQGTGGGEKDKPKEPPAAMADDAVIPDDEKEKEPAAMMSKAVSIELSRAKKAADEAEAVLSRVKQSTESVERENLIKANPAKLPGKLTEWARTQPVDALAAFLKDAPSYETPHLERPANEVITLSREHEELSKKLGTNPKYVAKILERDAAREREAS